jgi:phosphoribosyl 1,2-cyclic phosphate phosphodiesterase
VAFSVLFLGTGTSTGVPMIGCSCAVCQSEDVRDKRLRPAILVQTEQGNILVDAGPDMRTQMLRAGIVKIEATLLTHIHADHLMGLDDLRQFNFMHQMRMPLYGAKDDLDYVRRTFAYCFEDGQEGGGKPQIDLMPITHGEKFTLCGVEILPFRGLHGELEVTGYIFDNRFAYATDMNFLPDDTKTVLQNREAIVLGTVRIEPHPTHFGLQEAIDAMTELAPTQGYFTHISHRLGHAQTSAQLPKNIMVAWDGLEVRFPIIGYPPKGKGAEGQKNS